MSLSQRVMAAGCEKFVMSISQPEAELKFLVKAAADYEPMKVPGDVALRALKDTLAQVLLAFRNALDFHASQTGAKCSNTHTHTYTMHGAHTSEELRRPIPIQATDLTTSPTCTMYYCTHREKINGMWSSLEVPKLCTIMFFCSLKVRQPLWSGSASTWLRFTTSWLRRISHQPSRLQRVSRLQRSRRIQRRRLTERWACSKIGWRCWTT